MTLQPLSDPPAGLIGTENCDRDLLRAVSEAMAAAGDLMIRLRRELAGTQIRYVGPGGGWTMDPADWTVELNDARLCVVDDGGAYVAIVNDGRTIAVRVRGNARVDENGIVWRYVPRPVTVGSEERTNASCFGTRPPAPDPRSPEELLGIFFDLSEGPPWGWYRIGMIEGTPTAYPNAPVFPNGLRSADPNAPTRWGVLPRD